MAVPEHAVAYQDEAGDLYCPEHAVDRSRPVAAGELATWTNREPRCDYCGADLKAR